MLTPLLIALLACALAVEAQGTFQFVANLGGRESIPPNDSPLTVTAWLPLDENSSREVPGEQLADWIDC